MFDIGFWELSLLALVALLVVGPERLPKLARTAGLWIGKGRRLINSVRADIERELKAEELKKILDEQARDNPLEEILDDTNRTLRGIEKDTTESVSDARKQFETKDPESPKQVDDAK